MKTLILMARRLLVASICVLLVVSTPVRAAFVTTEQAAAMIDRQAVVTDIEKRLAAQDVRAALLRFGVAEADVTSRLAALSDAELLELQGELEDLPAGAGVIEVVGVVFIVLLILELVGVTNIFNSF